MRVKRIWKPIFVIADRRERSEFYNMLARMVDKAAGTNQRWELGRAAFVEFEFFAREEKKRLQMAKTFFGIMDEDPSPPTYLFGFPIKENRNLPEYAVVLHYEGKERDPKEREVSVHTTDGKEYLWHITEHAVKDGCLFLYNRAKVVAIYSAGGWIALIPERR